VKSGTLGSITYFLFLPIAQNLPIPIPILRKLPILFQNFQFSSNENWKLIGKKLEGDWRKKVYCVVILESCSVPRNPLPKGLS